MGGIFLHIPNVLSYFGISTSLNDFAASDVRFTFTENFPFA